LLEVVPEGRQHPAFKLLLGRLYHAGIQATSLQQSFGVDRKTMPRWGLLFTRNILRQTRRTGNGIGLGCLNPSWCVAGSSARKCWNISTP
jgi:hypothetical protein